MRMDIAPNYDIEEGLPALSRTVADYFTASIDHAKGPCGAFFVSCGVFATSLVATLQHSDDNSVWVDEEDTTAGNDVSITLTEASSGQINVPNPRARYSRVKLALGGTCVVGIASVLGPLRTLNE